MAMHGIRLWRIDENGREEYIGTDAVISGDPRDLRRRLEYHFGETANLWEDTNRVYVRGGMGIGELAGFIKYCFPEEKPFVRKAIEDAGLRFDTFEDGYTLPETGRRSVWGGWNDSGDWVVAGNTLAEIEGQLDDIETDRHRTESEGN